jgi:hypothetical protein
VFNIYVLFLILSGAAMLALATIRTGQVSARRVWNGILGVAFLGYGLYLLLFFQGGHYLLFYYVFILPVLMIVRFFRDRAAYRANKQAFGAQPFIAAQPGAQEPGFAQPPAGYSPQWPADQYPPAQ